MKHFDCFNKLFVSVSTGQEGFTGVDVVLQTNTISGGELLEAPLQLRDLSGGQQPARRLRKHRLTAEQNKPGCQSSNTPEHPQTDLFYIHIQPLST